MALKPTVNSLDDVDERYHDLYTESDGEFRLTGVEGLKTQADIDRIKSSLEKERNDHKTVKQRLQEFGDLDPEEVHSKLDRIAELEAAAGDKIDDAKINEMVETRIKSKTAPLERDRSNLAKENEELKSTLEQMQQRERQRTVHDAVRSAASTSKVLETAQDDVLLLAERVFEIDESGNVVTKDGVGVTPGINPQVWLTEMQSKRPHWWPPTQGGGAKGSGSTGFANNPFSAEHWNLTAQGQMVKENRSKAEQMAKSAGTSIGGPKPTK